MLHEEQLNTKLLLIHLTCNTPKHTFGGGYTSGHVMCLFFFFFFCLFAHVFACFIFNSLYEHAVLLAMSGLVAGKPENTSERSLARQPSHGSHGFLLSLTESEAPLSFYLARV